MFNSYRVNTLEFNEARCSGCGICVEVCPHGVFRMHNRKAELVEPEACMECGACSLNCQKEAIMVESGVGCATAMILAALRGRKKETCSKTEVCA